MVITTIESGYFCDLYSSSGMRLIFSDKSRITSWLQFEVALAKAQSRIGVIPQEVAQRIEEAAKLDNLDLIEMKADYDRVGFPISPLVKQLAKACDPESSKWIHWGATTQDVIDTGLVLQMKEALQLIKADLEAITVVLASLVEKHRSTIMVGRTFQQHAAPITFGYKASVWLDEILRHLDRLAELKKRVIVGQLGGAVGTLATLGDDGYEVRSELMKELDLEYFAVSWHTARDGWAELVHWLSMVGATFGKIATEVATLMRSEVNELREPYQVGRGSSSTMPQKRNPISAPPIIAISHKLRECVGTQLSAMIQEHERSVSGQPLEWLVIPEAFMLLSGSLKHSRDILEGLQVDEEQMLHNLSSSGGFLMAESVMMGLAAYTGRSDAHHIIADATSAALDEGIGLQEAILNNQQVMAHLTKEKVDELFDPKQYLGCSDQMINDVLTKYKIYEKEME